MILSEQVGDKLKALLAEDDSWKDLTGSQFVKMLATYMGWAVEDAAFKTERALQENFIDTALNRSSILALGEGIEYMPRKPVPAKGKMHVENTGEAAFTLLREREFMSDAQVVYTLDETVIVPAKSSVDVSISQREKVVVEETISEDKPFYEILLGKDISPKIASFKVFVDGEEWEYDRLLTNSYRDSLVYDEFYHFSDQIGIRFGNGEFGKIPAAGSVVSIEIIRTEGNTILLEKQSLWPVDEIDDENGEVASYTLTVGETVQNGTAQEGTEEMRRNLHYAPVYNERLIWDNDYKYFLRRRFPEIVFAVAWGEEEAERMWGVNEDWINRIWICAYSPLRDIQAEVMKAIEDVPMMCRNFQWFAPEHITFGVHLTGKVLPDCVISEVKESIINKLKAAYGKESRTRREVVLLHEIYNDVQDTGYFDRTTGAWFEITLTGAQKADYLYQMLSIDFDDVILDISYTE